MTSLREALIEIDALRKRDSQHRLETELVLAVVQVLANNPEGEGVVSKTLEAIAAGLGEPVTIYLTLDRKGHLKFPYLSGAVAPDHWQGAKFIRPDGLRKPGLVYDVMRLPEWRAPDLAGAGEAQSALIAPLPTLSGWGAIMLLRATAEQPFNASDFRVFKRVLPLLNEAMIRERNFIERSRMEMELRQMQKLEALGTLAGGIAHEINTPMQYVTNNVSFLSDAFTDVTAFIKDLQTGLVGDARPVLDQALQTLDYDFLAEELPLALSQTRDGLAQVTKIIQAIKEFSHPGSKVREPHDLNALIETALTVSRNQWKYAANVETHYDPDLPMVPCFADGLRQVVLNLVVNAAHAIEDKVGDNTDTEGDGSVVKDLVKELGTITLRTAREDGFVRLEITDTGKGMPQDIQDRIFDPFFTTKAPGRGTGQGLSICHSIVVQKHEGRIDVTSAEGQGSTFSIWLPLQVDGADQDLIG